MKIEYTLPNGRVLDEQTCRNVHEYYELALMTNNLESKFEIDEQTAIVKAVLIRDKSVNHGIPLREALREVTSELKPRSKEQP